MSPSVDGMFVSDRILKLFLNNLKLLHYFVLEILQYVWKCCFKILHIYKSENKEEHILVCDI